MTNQSSTFDSQQSSISSSTVMQSCLKSLHYVFDGGFYLSTQVRQRLDTEFLAVDGRCFGLFTKAILYLVVELDCRTETPYYC
ncbi:MAG: hypothetical protein EZS28_036940 [Streblomastix strix]|uniref:Uncharacterized protein n=1 Tax=Streblomastix strix TaxID=222440 RepID=A0A5J4UCD6_9EUKA|nr:MAG: hypothetical protein EZS28_036940 [Streblomastix strix]